MLSQRTIRNKITASGVGLHSGKRVNLTFHPAEPNTGVVFRVIDGDKKTEIPAILAHVGDTTLSTSLEKDGYKISTIEHLLSALAGTGVDNCIMIAMAQKFLSWMAVLLSLYFSFNRLVLLSRLQQRNLSTLQSLFRSIEVMRWQE